MEEDHDTVTMLTREQFQEAFNVSLGAAMDPDSEVNQIALEGRRIACQIFKHDPVLVMKCTNICEAIEAYVTYVKSKANR